MLASCSICGDVFTGIHPESVNSTPCGHVFHYDCLMQWIQRSQTCPHCRSKVTDKQIIKLYFHNNSNLSVKEDISSLTHQVQSLSFQNTLKDEQITNLVKETKKEKEQLVALKKYVKDAEDKVRYHQTFVSSLQEKIRFFKSECVKTSCYKLEAQELKKELEKYQSINNILYGTPADSQEAVCLLKKNTDIQTLCLLITSFKREIHTLKQSNKDLETKSSHRFAKYLELKRHLFEINSKESMHTRVIQKLKSDICDLESEIARISKNNDLNPIIATNGSTPKRTELRKRMLHESPAPMAPLSPVIDVLEQTILKNSVSRSPQPNNGLIYHLGKGMEKPSSHVNPFTPKSPRRPVGLINAHITSKSATVSYAKPMVSSSSSDEETYDGLGGRSKPDIFPNPLKKPLTKKRKLVSNFKKKPPPSNGNKTLDGFLSSENL